MIKLAKPPHSAALPPLRGLSRKSIGDLEYSINSPSRFCCGSLKNLIAKNKFGFLRQTVCGGGDPPIRKGKANNRILPFSLL
jgi:hypothetical protein